MLLGNKGFYCCCRTLFRTTQSSKPQSPASLFKRFSHGASSVLPRRNIALLESITGRKLTPQYLSRCSSFATLCNARVKPATYMNWSEVSEETYVPPAAPTPNLDHHNCQKFDDILLYSHNNAKECLVLNVLGVMLFGALSYTAYLLHTAPDLFVSQEEFEQIGNMVRATTVERSHRYFDIVPYRDVASGFFLALGCFILGVALKNSLRSVHRFTLLRDWQTLVLTTNNLLGQPVTRSVPVSQVHTKSRSLLMKGCDSCLLHVAGTRVPYALDGRGTVHEPVLVSDLLAILRKQEPKEEAPIGI